jgi:AcrR family transcriptional regulator
VNNEHESTKVRQKQIVNAAKNIIIKKGSEHLTVRRIAEEVGLTEGAVYRHFYSKKEILSFLLTDIEQSLISDLGGKNNGKLDSLDSLQAILMSYVIKTKKRQGVPFQVIAEIISLGDAELNHQAYHVIQIFIDRIKEIVSEGIETGTIKSDINPDTVSILLFGAIQGLVNIWTLSHYQIEFQQKYEDVWRLFSQAISKN